MDLGDRLNLLREEYVKADLTKYQDFDIGVKLIIAAALVELVKDNTKLGKYKDE